jgi:glycosyltransferase involved in cell wall biosynthesis
MTGFQFFDAFDQPSVANVNKPRSLIIFGTRGIPAAHGGFETFAEHLALFLVGRGWRVVVYCQRETSRVEQRVTTDLWRGVELRHVSVSTTGPRATLDFDWHCIRDSASIPGICLVLGYNSGIFLAYLRLLGRRIITNMDGIEWRRRKWGRVARVWLWMNEWAAATLSHRLVADHPEIARHLATRRNASAIAMIPYGGIRSGDAPAKHVLDLGLQPKQYLLSIARIEPDNCILEIVTAFSARRRHMRLLVVGKLAADNPYHQRIRSAASDEDVVWALRRHARAYLHGHTVGGTNPSLVESLWAGNAVIAHDNCFNRWTAGEAGAFFRDTAECDGQISRVVADDDWVEKAALAALRQAETHFRWPDVLEAYEREALRLVENASPRLKAVGVTSTTPGVR